MPSINRREGPARCTESTIGHGGAACGYRREIIHPMRPRGRRPPSLGPNPNIPCPPPGGCLMAAIAADRHLLFGLLALQNGLINQAQLLAAFQAWTLDRAKSLADHLPALGHLNDDHRAAVEAMAALHVETRRCRAEPGRLRPPAPPARTCSTGRSRHRRHARSGPHLRTTGS